MRRLVARGALPPPLLGAVAAELVAIAREASGDDATPYKLLADASALHLLTDTTFLTAFEGRPSPAAPAPARSAPPSNPPSPARLAVHRPAPRAGGDASRTATPGGGGGGGATRLNASTASLAAIRSTAGHLYRES